MPIRKTLDLDGIGATATTVLLVVGLTLLGPGTARAQPDQLQGAVQEADAITVNYLLTINVNFQSKYLS